MNLQRPIILASNSPRRKQLLQDMGLRFTVRSMNVEEDFPSHMPLTEVPIYLAQKKALVFTGEISNEIVIAADTVVIVEGRILNKPQDEQEAFEMLSLLSGRRHDVITGVSIYAEERQTAFSDLTEVYFKNLSEEEIWFYIHTYKPFDKAGAYGAQEWMGMIAVEKIVGSYFNVMGLPVHKLYEVLRSWENA